MYINQLLLPSRRRLYIEAHGCKSWVPKLLIVPHALHAHVDILIANITYMYCIIILLENVHKSQVNVHIHVHVV